MVEQQLDAKSSSRPETSKGHYLLEIAGIAIFAVLAVLTSAEIFGGAVEFGYVWLLAILAVLAYLTADFLSGFVHFLADNFGSYDTPVIGPGFIDAFREHHVDPKGITTHDFVDTNGNNSLVAIPFMLLVWLAVPIETALWAYLFGAFSLFLCVATFLTNQFHKWAHMENPRPPSRPGSRSAALSSTLSTTTSTTLAPTTPTTASPPVSGTPCSTGCASSSAPSASSAASSPLPIPNFAPNARAA